MDDPVSALVVFAELVNLGVAVVAGGNAVICARRLDLLVLETAIGQALLLVSCL